MIRGVDAGAEIGWPDAGAVIGWLDAGPVIGGLDAGAVIRGAGGRSRLHYNVIQAAH